MRWDHKTMNSQAIGWISLVVTIFAGATYNSFAKQLTGTLSPLSLLFLSELLTGIFVLFSFGALPTAKRVLQLPRRLFLPLFIVGFLNSALAPFLWFAGLHYTSAVNASLFSYSDTLFLIFLAVFVLRETWTNAHLCAATCVTLGIVLIILRGFEHGIHLQTGDMLILLASLTFSVGSIVFRKFLHNTEPQIVIFVRSCIAVAMFFLLSPFMPHPLITEIMTFKMTLIPALLGFAFISRFLSVFSFYASIERLPVSTVSLMSSLGIVIGPLFAYLYIGQAEALSWYHFVGGGCILLGTVLLELLGVHPSEQHLEQHLTQRAHRRS